MTLTLQTLACILSDIPLSRGGPTSVVIFDIHALQACYASDLLAPGNACAVLMEGGVGWCSLCKKCKCKQRCGVLDDCGLHIAVLARDLSLSLCTIVICETDSSGSCH